LPIVGVEDGRFQKGKAAKTVLVAVLFKNLHIEDVKLTSITVDGLDATAKLKEMLTEWSFEVILLAGISFAGFNIIDPILIHEKFQKPVIVVTRKKPDNNAVRKALKKHFNDWKMRFEVFEKTGLPYKKITFTSKSAIYFKAFGASDQWTFNLVRALSFLGIVPEPLRVARLIARGLS